MLDSNGHGAILHVLLENSGGIVPFCLRVAEIGHALFERVRLDSHSRCRVVCLVQVPLLVVRGESWPFRERPRRFVVHLARVRRVLRMVRPWPDYRRSRIQLDEWVKSFHGSPLVDAERRR